MQRFVGKQENVSQSLGRKVLELPGNRLLADERFVDCLGSWCVPPLFESIGFAQQAGTLFRSDYSYRSHFVPQ
jgi:hypothetical protein